MTTDLVPNRTNDGTDAPKPAAAPKQEPGTQQASKQEPGTQQPSKQAPTKASTVEERSAAFHAVEGGTELQSGAQLLVEAYAAVWIVLFVFVAISWRRQRGIEARIADLETRLGQPQPRAAHDVDAPDRAGG